MSDLTQTIAQPIGLLPGADAPTFVSALGGIVSEYEAERVIIGIPRSMDGRMGEMAKWAEGIRRVCERELPVPVEGRDERLSTVSADRAMRESRGGRKGRSSTPRIPSPPPSSYRPTLTSNDCAPAGIRARHKSK